MAFLVFLMVSIPKPFGERSREGPCGEGHAPGPLNTLMFAVFDDSDVNIITNDYYFC